MAHAAPPGGVHINRGESPVKNHGSLSKLASALGEFVMPPILDTVLVILFCMVWPAYQALIGYHFGGKPGLYLAALRSIAASVSTRIGPLVESIEAQLEADGAARTGKKVAERALAALQALLEAFVGMLASDDSAAWARLILREQQNPSDGFDVLYEGFMHRILGVASELVARAQNRGASAAQCKLAAFTILGQAIVFRAARAAVMREMQWQRLGAQVPRGGVGVGGRDQAGGRPGRPAGGRAVDADVAEVAAVGHDHVAVRLHVGDGTRAAHRAVHLIGMTVGRLDSGRRPGRRFVDIV